MEKINIKCGNDEALMMICKMFSYNTIKCRVTKYWRKSSWNTQSNVHKICCIQSSYFKIIWIKQNMLYSLLKLKFAFGISQPNLQKYLLRELSSDNIIIFCPTSWIDTHTRNLPIKQIVYVYIISSNIKYLFRLLFI